MILKKFLGSFLPYNLLQNSISPFWAKYFSPLKSSLSYHLYLNCVQYFVLLASLKTISMDEGQNSLFEEVSTPMPNGVFKSNFIPLQAFHHLTTSFLFTSSISYEVQDTFF